MSYADIEHYATMVDGCEAITLGNYKTENARYAQTVLRMHANDMGLYAGNEGFLDNVKQGAAKVGEWVKKLIAAIRAWFTSSKKKGAEIDSEIKAAEAQVEKLPADKKEEFKKKDEPRAKNLSSQAKGLLSKLDNIESQMKGGVFESLGHTVSLKSAKEMVEKAGEATKGSLDVGSSYRRASARIGAEMEAISKALESAKGEDAEKEKLAKAVAGKLTALAGIVNQIDTITSNLAKKNAAELHTILNEKVKKED